MENLVIENLFSRIYKGKTVLVTGHTGFKGSWLSLWLKQMGATVIGYSSEIPTNPNHFDLLDLDIVSIMQDIRNSKKLEECVKIHRPDIVFHLAAQPLVRYSYGNPVETFEVNVLGTLKVLEASKASESLHAIVVITSDKCYENKEWVWGYRESDPMGGYDPYSASKGCTELVVSSYRNSFCNPAHYGTNHSLLLASCRAGNVIGGGDWARDRLMTDIMVAANQKKKTAIRNPLSTRPWQHVLEPLSGYLMVGQRLLEGKKEYGEGWNFGPGDDGTVTVQEVTRQVQKWWGKVDFHMNQQAGQPHEARLLKLDCSKAHARLPWRALWTAEETFEKTVKWYKEFYENGKLNSFNDLNAYIFRGREKKATWAT